jgi:glycosyltransferase involved in cell wall biosynthesis
VPDQKITEVGTGVDTELFSRDGELRPAGAQTFVYAGTISEIQGASVFVDGFLTIASEFPDARLLIFGRGTEEPELRERASGHPQIEFRGQVPGDEVAAWLRSARAGLASVRPSRGYDFAFATKAFTALSCGTPVLYAGVGPTREFVTDNDLGEVTDWNVEAVAEAMRRMLGTEVSEAERVRLASWAQSEVSLNAVARKAVLAVERVTASSGRVRR